VKYDDIFGRTFGKVLDQNFEPFEYQRNLAENPWPVLLDVPTGMGENDHGRAGLAVEAPLARAGRDSDRRAGHPPVPRRVPRLRRWACALVDGFRCKVSDQNGKAMEAPKVTLSLDPMEVGLSARYR
jgi:hypothetical protein